jgi:hypothetical protein
MKNAKNLALLIAAVAMLCVLAAGVGLQLRSARSKAPSAHAVTVADAMAKAPPAPAVEAPAPTLSAPELDSPAPSGSPEKPPAELRQQPLAAQTNQLSGRPAKEPLQDPDAREALALVGWDPGAEAYWYAAINDPRLPAHERQDLIEDLNEDGLVDPKHPTPQDLPLILSRIWLIEEIGGESMDKVNADAFQEAYKDLLNLADLALGGGEPVR